MRSLITNPDSKFRNSKWRIQYGGSMYKKLIDWDDILYAGVFGVTDYESELKVKKFKMADPIWQNYIQEVN